MTGDGQSRPSWNLDMYSVHYLWTFLVSYHRSQSNVRPRPAQPEAVDMDVSGKPTHIVRRPITTVGAVGEAVVCFESHGALEQILTGSSLYHAFGLQSCPSCETVAHSTTHFAGVLGWDASAHCPWPAARQHLSARVSAGCWLTKTTCRCSQARIAAENGRNLADAQLFQTSSSGARPGVKHDELLR